MGRLSAWEKWSVASKAWTRKTAGVSRWRWDLLQSGILSMSKVSQIHEKCFSTYFSLHLTAYKWWTSWNRKCVFIMCMDTPIRLGPQLWPEGIDATLINDNYFSEKLGLILDTKKHSSIHLEIICGHWREWWNITCQKRTPRPRIFQGFIWHSVKSYPSGDAFLQQIQVRVPFPANTTHNGTTDFEGNKFFPSSCRNCWV